MFALLVAPPAAAQQITMRPLAGLVARASLFALLVVWLGLGVAYFSIYPVGFYTTTFAFGLSTPLVRRALGTRRARR